MPAEPRDKKWEGLVSAGYPPNDDEETKQQEQPPRGFPPDAPANMVIKLTEDEEHDIELGPRGLSRSSSSSSSSSSQGESTQQQQLSRFGGSIKAQELQWHVKDYKIKLRRGGEKVILRDIVGKAEAGSFSAVMGPSGCGKTSLLDCLALRNRNFTGTLRLDGQALTGNYFLNTGYVHQKELFFSHMTVREHLTFHSINRLSRVRTQAECLARVDGVIDEVDLRKVADTQIGGGELYVSKGISGGERKRLNIATELLADPSILLLDEPTSGLDSVMGEMICLLLHSLAMREPQRIIITALHSPSSRVFSLFTHLTLLSGDGQLAYWGPRHKILHFLKSLGYHCPPRFNPADFILELASTKIIQGHAPEGVTLRPISSYTLPHVISPPRVERMESNDAASSMNGSSDTGVGASAQHALVLLMLSDSSPKLIAAMSAKAVAVDLRERLDSDNRHKDVHTVRGARSSLFTIFMSNCKRAWVQETREKTGLIVRAVMNVLLGLVFGLLYFNQIPRDNGRNTMGFLFSLIVTMVLASSINVCLHFPFDFAILMREYYAGANTPVPYFLGRTLASLPTSLLFLVMGIIPYWMAGLVNDASAFAYFVLVLFLTNFAAQSVGFLASSWSRNPVVGLSVLPLIITPMILFSSLLYQKSSVPKSLSWLQSLSIVNFAYGLLVLNQIEKVGGGVQKFLLNFLELRSAQFNVYLIDLAVLGVAYRLLAMLVLAVRVRYISKPN